MLSSQFEASNYIAGRLEKSEKIAFLATIFRCHLSPEIFIGNCLYCTKWKFMNIFTINQTEPGLEITLVGAWEVYLIGVVLFLFLPLYSWVKVLKNLWSFLVKLEKNLFSPLKIKYNSLFPSHARIIILPTLDLLSLVQGGSCLDRLWSTLIDRYRWRYGQKKKASYRSASWRILALRSFMNRVVSSFVE